MKAGADFGGLGGDALPLPGCHAVCLALGASTRAGRRPPVPLSPIFSASAPGRSGVDDDGTTAAPTRHLLVPAPPAGARQGLSGLAASSGRREDGAGAARFPGIREMHRIDGRARTAGPQIHKGISRLAFAVVAVAALVSPAASSGAAFAHGAPEPWGTPFGIRAAGAAASAGPAMVNSPHPSTNVNSGAKRDSVAGIVAAPLGEIRGGGPPPMALCFDFDQTLCQQHLHRLVSGARGGMQGVDLHQAFGGRERIQRLGRFLGDARELGAAVHIISHNHKRDIIQALSEVGLGPHFPPDSIVGWGELKEASLATKSECATRIADAYGISRQHCMLVDDDQDNLDDAEEVMTYWVSSGAGLSDDDMSTLLGVCRTMKVAPHRLALSA